jgi:prepilin-type processing-associated H-X9-DG protein
LAFTLVELLVTVIIIALIIAIMGPVLSRAREAAARAHCKTNLRQLTLAWQAYATDNDRELCSHKTNRFNTFNRTDVPSGAQMYFSLNCSNWVCDGPLSTEVINTIGGTETAISGGSGAVGMQPGVMVRTEPGALWKYAAAAKVFKCRQDKSKLARSYSMSEAMGGGNYMKISEIYEISEKAVFIEAETKSLPWLDGPFEVGQITSRHNKGSNLSYADGHCEYRKYSGKEPGSEDIQFFRSRTTKGKRYR